MRVPIGVPDAYMREIQRSFLTRRAHRFPRADAPCLCPGYLLRRRERATRIRVRVDRSKCAFAGERPRDTVGKCGCHPMAS